MYLRKKQMKSILNGNSKVTFEKVFKGIIFLTIIPFFFFFIFSEEIFVVLFGDECIQAAFMPKS